MGSNGGMSNSVRRGFAMPSSDVPPLPQWIPLDQILVERPKYTRSGELRRALGFPLGSSTVDAPPFRGSGYKPSPPVATEELKQFKDNVLDASMKARERSKMFNDSIYKLDKYILTKKRQHSELLSTEKPGGASLLKMAGQPPRNLLDQAAQRMEDKAKSGGLNKRVRSSSATVDSRPGSLPKDQSNNGKDSDVNKGVAVASVQPEERRLSAVGEGWDKKIKRKRSFGAVANRSVGGDVKRTMHAKLSTDSKMASSDISTSRSNSNQVISTANPSKVIKGRISRAPRTGSAIVVNSSSDVQVSESFEEWEPSITASKVISLDAMQNQTVNSSHALGKWVGQRQQKSSRIRRTNVVSPVSKHDESEVSALSYASPATGARNSLYDISGSLDTVDVHDNTSKSKIKVESAPSSVRLLDVEETKSSLNKVEEKVTTCIDVAANGKGKVRSFLFPMKRNKNAAADNVIDGVKREGRVVRGSSLLRPGVAPCEAKSENVSMVKPVQIMRPGSEKIRSKSGRPPSRKLLDGRAITRTTESDDDHEELLAAAASARKASYLSCSERFWKKMEPIFGSVNLQDANYLKQQVSFAQELEESLSQIPDMAYNVVGVFQQKERLNHSYRVVDKDGLSGGRRLDKFSSLYQRVLSAMIEEDESEGTYNGNEGVCLSFQCASDDSHCGSCNYTDAEIRDRDRLESEAESIVDFQRHCSGDRFSCNRSKVSNNTRNTSMSDSLYSSGRWLGDDGLSHSDVEFASGVCQNDESGLQHADLTLPSTFSDCQYQLMSVDEKLILELQNIGLYIDTMPDLVEGEEVIDGDIIVLREGLCEQIGKKKQNLVKVDNAVQDDREREKRHIEQVAMEQLVQMAYKRRMACRRNNTSKSVMRRVSKQVAMGFIERTVARCKNFELTGRNCFSEPALQNVLFEGTHAGANMATDTNTGHADLKHPTHTAKPDSTSIRILDSCIDDPERGSVECPQAIRQSFEPALHSRGTTISNSSEKEKSKPKHNSVNVPSSVVGREEEEEEPIDFSRLPLPDFDSIEQLGVSNGPGGNQDFGSWLDGFDDHDSEGLLIPMDDLQDLGDFHI